MKKFHSDLLRRALVPGVSLSLVAGGLHAAPVQTSSGETIITGGQAAEVTSSEGVKVVPIKDTPEKLRRALEGSKFNQ